jgi:hypothetical protein
VDAKAHADALSQGAQKYIRRVAGAQADDGPVGHHLQGALGHPL